MIVEKSIYLLEAVVKFITVGKENKSHDAVGYVTQKFFDSNKEFKESEIVIDRNKNGFVINGTWTKGDKYYNWILETWGERGEVVVKFDIWNDKVKEWQAYRTTVAYVDKTVDKFIRKVFIPTRILMDKNYKINGDSKLGTRFKWKTISNDKGNDVYSVEIVGKKQTYIIQIHRLDAYDIRGAKGPWYVYVNETGQVMPTTSHGPFDTKEIAAKNAVVIMIKYDKE